jgi:hypothetical protein
MKVYAPASNGGPLLTSDRQKASALDQTLRDDLSKFLTPAEVADYMMRGSEVGAQLRNMLSPIGPTEGEFRSIFPIYQAVHDQYPTPAGNLPPDQVAAQKAAEDQMYKQVSALLGPERAADFQQAANPNYYQLNHLVARLELPISAATQVAAVQTDIQERASTVRNDNSLSTDDRNAQLAALAQEASTKVSAALGSARGVEAYKQYGGQWLANLRPQAPPAKSP